MQYLLFSLDTESFAIELECVERVIFAVAIRHTHGISNHFEGCIVLQNESIPVINIRKQLSFPHKDLDINDQFIIVNYQGVRAALWVNYVDTIFEQENPCATNKGVGYFSQHLLRDEGEVVYIYDIGNLKREMAEVSGGEG